MGGLSPLLRTPLLRSDTASRISFEEAVVRITAGALARMPFIFPPAMSRAATAAAGAPDETGWLDTVVPIESIEHGHTELLKLGAEVEVLAPAELRERFAETAGALVSLYRT